MSSERQFMSMPSHLTCLASNPKQLSCPKKAMVEKRYESKVAAKNSYDGRLIAKNLVPMIQMNLCCFLHRFGTIFT